MLILKSKPFIPHSYIYGFQSIRFTRAFLRLCIYIHFPLNPCIKNIVNTNYDFLKSYTLRSLKKISAKIKNTTALLFENDKSPVTCAFMAIDVYYQQVVFLQKVILRRASLSRLPLFLPK